MQLMYLQIALEMRCQYNHFAMRFNRSMQFVKIRSERGNRGFMNFKTDAGPTICFYA